MKIVVLYIVVVVNSLVFSQVTLPAYKNGTWWLIQGNKHTEMPKGIDFIGIFDSKNKALFIKNNKYGILDIKGNIVLSPDFLTIESYGSGIFYCVDSSTNMLLDIESGEKIMIDNLKVMDLNKMYLHVQQDSLQYIIYKESKKISVYPESFIVKRSYLNTVLIKVDSTDLIFHHFNGKDFQTNEYSIDYTSKYILLRNEHENLLITENNEFPFSAAISNVEVYSNYLSYYDGKFAHLLSLETNEEILKLPYHSIQPSYFGGYFVSKDQSVGWVNENLQLKIPIKYDYINKINSTYEVHKSGYTGLYDSLFRVKIPCEFSHFVSKGDFIKVYSLVNTIGVFSNITNRMLLTPIYDQVLIEKDFLKAYNGNKIRMLELSRRHKILTDYILDNAITAKQAINPKDRNYNYDTRLLSLGWFLESKEIIDTVKSISYYKHFWGLKNENDSVLLPAKYKLPVYIPNMPFSLIPQNKVQYNMITGQTDKKQFYQMKSHLNGKTLNDLKVIYLDTMDCYKRKFVRFETTDGHRIWYKKDSIVTINYIENSDNAILRYCRGGKAEFTESTTETIQLNQYNLHNTLSFELSYFDPMTSTQLYYVQFKNAKWNFLNSEGQNLFKDNFEFVEAFYKNTALVKSKTGWGVVSKDSLIIPMKFAEIKRLPQFKDTVFCVKLNHSGSRYLNNTTELIKDKFNYIRTIDDLDLLKINEKYTVQKNGNNIVEGLSNASLLDDNYYFTRKSKEYHVSDENGEEVFTSKNKPKKVLNDNFLLVVKSGKNALVNNSDAILIPFAKQEITQIGDFIESRILNSVAVYNKELKILYTTKSDEKIFIDKFTSQFAVSSKNKISIYDNNGKLVSKFKQLTLSPIILFQNGLFISKDCLFNETDSLNISKEAKIIYLENGYLGIENGNSSTKVYSNSIKENFLLLDGKNCKYLGENVFCFTNKKGLFLKNKEKELKIGTYAKVVGSFKDGFCLVTYKDASYFYTPELKIAFNRSFEDATSFNNHFATIKEKEGWTIIDQMGILQSIPNFNRIEQLTKNIFETTNKSTYGLYDMHGNEIVAPIYERITIITQDIIQVMKNGEIGYFNAKGIVVFDIE